MILLVLWLKGGGGGGSGQTLCSERSELQRAQRANASESSESSRMRVVVYLKLLTRQTKKPHTTQTKNCPDHTPKPVQKTHTKYGVWEQRTEVPGERGGGGSRA